MDTTETALKDLVDLLKKRNEAIAQRALKRFQQSYQDHFPKDQGILPLTDPAQEKAKDAPEKIEAVNLPLTDEAQNRAGIAPKEIEKIVFLLGAGVSKSAGLKLASEIVKECEELLGKEILQKEVQKFREHQELENEPRYRWGQALISREGDYSFEEVLSAYHRIVGEKELLDMMDDHFLVGEKDFENKTLITLFNECLAHLCREHLVDFIVSLNFDELLEHSLNEDIGSNGYVAIHNPARFQWGLSHGLVKGDKYMNPDQRNWKSGCEQAKPWLLKPHGTISHKSTLRNMVDQVWRFEKATEDVLRKVFENSHVVVVGYSLSAADIHRVLLPLADSGSLQSIYWVDIKPRVGPMGSDLRRILEKKKPGGFHKLQYKADLFALNLVKKLYLGRKMLPFQSGTLPPFRHLLRAYLFAPGSNKCTFANRFLAECICFAIRMKGWFSSRSLGKSHQIQHLLKQATKSDQEILFSFPKKLEPAFESILIKGRTERIYFLRRSMGKISVETKLFQKLYESAFTFLSGKVSDPWLNQLRNIGKKMINAIKKSPEADMAVYQDHEDIGTFNRVCMIPNRVVLNAVTDWLLSEPKDGFYIVTEIGSFLKKRKVKLDTIEMTTADYRKIIESICTKYTTLKKAKPKIWVDDIDFSQNQIDLWKKPSILKAFRVLDIDKKRLHFTLRKEGDLVKGILYNRLFCQAGATFYWVELIVDDRHLDEKHQFEALLDK